MVPRFSGDDLVRWAWTEPSVWTNSMLEILEQSSVRGGKWHSLIDKVYKRENLLSAYREVAANWESQRYEIAWSRMHYVMYWNRFLNGNSPNTATAFAPSGDVKTR